MALPPCRPGLTLLRPTPVSPLLRPRAGPRPLRCTARPFSPATPPVPAGIAGTAGVFMIGVDSGQIDHVIYPNDGIELTGAPSVRASRCDRPGSGVTSLWRPRSSAAE